MENKELNSLQRKRRILQRQLVRHQEAVQKESNLSVMNKINIQLQELIKEFNMIQSKIEETVDDNGFEDEIVERDKFERLHDSLTHKITALNAPQNNISNIETHNVSNNIEMHNVSNIETHNLITLDAPQNGYSTSVNTSNTNSNAISEIKLPNLQMPIFTGNYEDWNSFFDIFNSIVGQNTTLHKVQKLYYLKSCLKNEAAKLLSNVSNTEANYEYALGILKSRYDNKKLIVNNHISKLLNLPIVRIEHPKQLRHLINTVCENLDAIKALNIPTSQWDPMINSLLLSKLDSETRKAWEFQTAEVELPTFNQLNSFIQQRIQALETVGGKLSSNMETKPQNFKVHNAITNNNTKICPILCDSNHPIYQCDKFHNLSPPERLKIVKSLKLCINCLSKGHFLNQCKSSKCKICHNSHHSLLHRAVNPGFKFADAAQQSTNNSQQSPDTSQQPSLSACAQGYNHVLLATAIINIEDSTGKYHQARAMLDCGSQSNFIKSSLVAKLKLNSQESINDISGIGNSFMQSKSQVLCNIASTTSSYKRSILAIALPKITSDLPTAPINFNEFSYPKTIKLADPNFFNVSSIDILLGAEVSFEVISNGKICCNEGSPSFQNTQLGWVAVGKIQQQNSTNVYISCCSLREELTRFWELEETPKVAIMSEEERCCEDYYQRTTERDLDGRYIVKLPFKTSVKELGDSKSIALKRFQQIRTKFRLEPQIKIEYEKFMSEYLRLGHMRLVTSFDQTSNYYYLPHHCVLKPDSTTTKLRVVFDGSIKPTDGQSLNKVLMVGPTIQDTLFAILLRFRYHKYALVGDIEKMYRQIKINNDHVNYQRIFWSFNDKEPPDEYCLTTVTYGTASASYLAIKTLHWLAENEGHKFPIAAQILKRDMYVDDLITSFDTIEDAIQAQSQMNKLLNLWGFSMRKWASNQDTILRDIPTKDRECQVPVDFEGSNHLIKTLGVYWNPIDDYFQFQFMVTRSSIISKRIILSEIARIYDPLGLISPIVIQAKILIQKLWLHNLNWDDSLPPNIQEEWMSIKTDLANSRNITINRYITNLEQVCAIEIHGFCDASINAYSACIYVRCSSLEGITTKLLCSKSRVAPLKQISIPRLELCGALLLSKLLKMVTSSLANVERYYLWTDSRIVLAWLQGEPRRWKTFVSNRVSEIQSLTDISCWNHVSTHDNPADIGCRGQSADKLNGNTLWWNGASFLANEQWRSEPSRFLDEVVLPDQRNVTIAMHVTDNLRLFHRRSSYISMQNVAAYCIRFVHNSRVTSSNRISGALTIAELQGALNWLVKQCQSESFIEDINRLKQGKLSKGSLRSLNPFLDGFGILRVGGRLQNSDLTYNHKHPMLIPANHQFTKLLIQHEHKRSFHAGSQLLLSIIRQNFWIINGKNTIRKEIRLCVKCIRHKATTQSTIMGNLPSNRISVSSPFQHTGIDYGGPFFVKQMAGRSRIEIKAYVCLFICFSTKAIHIELVSSLTTEGFLNALRRFVSRCGIPSDIYSDNATNFVGANNELQELYKFLNTNSDAIQDYSITTGIQWHFIPPGSPHFGGLWEAGIKSIKSHLKRVIGIQRLTFEEFNTVLVQIEACLNSRPIHPLSSDPNDLQPLTPGHFLIGKSLLSLPNDQFEHIPITRLRRWQFLQQIVQDYWRRWSAEYLHNLQQRTKWKIKEEPVRLNQLALLVEPAPPAQWKMCRICKLFLGNDGEVRIVEVLTKDGVFKRPITKLVFLPIT